MNPLPPLRRYERNDVRVSIGIEPDGERWICAGIFTRGSHFDHVQLIDWQSWRVGTETEAQDILTRALERDLSLWNRSEAAPE